MTIGFEDVKEIRHAAYWWALGQVRTAHRRHEIIHVENFAGRAWLVSLLHKAMYDSGLWSPLKLLP